MAGSLRLHAFTRPVAKKNGDTYTFVEQGDKLLMGVIDGLGHGGKASIASEMAKKYIEENASESLEELIWGCHHNIKKTRGAVIGLARIDFGIRKLRYAGIGDVEACIIDCGHKRPVSRTGILGHNVRKVSTYEYDLPYGFVVFIHSDGVSRRFDPDNYPLKSDPEKAIELIVKDWGKETDDITFIVAAEEVEG